MAQPLTTHASFLDFEFVIPIISVPEQSHKLLYPVH